MARLRTVGPYKITGFVQVQEKLQFKMKISNPVQVLDFLHIQNRGL